MIAQKEQIVSILKQVVPEEDAEKILFYLQGKSNISEFIIAEELDLEIHRTRNLLYRLLSKNLVSFKRKKDKIKGWYICYWDFNDSALPHLEEKLRLETIEKLKARLANESGEIFYMCRSAHSRQNFEDAFEENFKCPECGELMNPVDNSRTVDFLKSRIADLEKTQELFVIEKNKKLELARIEAERLMKEEAELKKSKSKVKVKTTPKRNVLRKLPKKEIVSKFSSDGDSIKDSSNKSSSNKSSVKKVSKKKSVKKIVKKTPVKKSSSKNSSIKKSTRKLPIKKTNIKKSSVKKVSKKSSVKKTPVKKSSSKKIVKKTSVKKVSKKSSVKKSSVKKSSSKKKPVKKTKSVKKVSKKSSVKKSSVKKVSKKKPVKKTFAKKIGNMFRK